MKKYVCDLLALITNYAEHEIADGNTCDVINILQTVRDSSTKELTDEEKSSMYWETVHALNDGSDDAMEGAFLIRLKALASGDDAFADKIEYLWDVI